MQHIQKTKQKLNKFFRNLLYTGNLRLDKKKNKHKKALKFKINKF